MSQKIKRRAGTARKAAAQQGKAAKARAVRARTGSALDAVMAWVPLSDEALHRVFLVIILGGALALAALVAAQAGVPTMANQQMATVAANAGFEVHRVEVRGTRHLNELKVYERVLVQRDRAMTEVDLAALRADLLQLSWVKDARVSRQLPDTLVVDIVERKPHAVLRQADHLVLIDETGAPLDPISEADAKGMLVLSGNGVSDRVAALAGLLNVAPALKPQVAEAEWVGNRRWNILFKTGQVLALPEGDQASADALVSFARLDGINRLLGGRVVAFDMRAPDRIYLRVPHAPASGAPQTLGSVAAASSAALPSAAAALAVADGAGTKAAAAIPSAAPHVAAAVVPAKPEHSGLSPRQAEFALHAAHDAARAAHAAHAAKSSHLAKAELAAKPEHSVKPAHLAALAHPAKADRPAKSVHVAKSGHAAVPSHLAKGDRAIALSHPSKSAHAAKLAERAKAAPAHAAGHNLPHVASRTMPHNAKRPVAHTASRDAN